MKKEDYENRVKRLKDANKIIAELDPAIRHEAFTLLRDYITGTPTRPPNGAPTPPEEDNDRDAFFVKYAHQKPSENVNLLASHHFREYGSEPFSIMEIRDLASEVGVTIPDRVDMTLKQSKNDGRTLYKRLTNGDFKPTVHGEAYLRETYSVKKGKKKKPITHDTD